MATATQDFTTPPATVTKAGQIVARTLRRRRRLTTPTQAYGDVPRDAGLSGGSHAPLMADRRPPLVHDVVLFAITVRQVPSTSRRPPSGRPKLTTKGTLELPWQSYPPGFRRAAVNVTTTSELPYATIGRRTVPVTPLAHPSRLTNAVKFRVEADSCSPGFTDQVAASPPRGC